jgi:transcriptional regulator
MYIPQHYVAADKGEMLQFMQAYSFATIVTANGNRPVATHLPFVVAENAGVVTLTSHFAKGNPQWEGLEGNEALVVFAEPHAYISPKHYDSAINVPTWNYVAVHAYGKPSIITGHGATLAVLEAMINNFEQGYKAQWDALPMDYKLKMLNGIVAFSIEVTDLQAKKKLSQNKNEAER